MIEGSEPILDRVLESPRLQACFRPTGGEKTDFGSSADIYHSSVFLSEPERSLIYRIKGRFPSPYLLLKVALPGGSPITNAEELRRDSIMLADPIIQHFAVASSGVRNTSLGPTMLVEEAEGFDITNSLNVRRLNPEDFVRITYQLAIINQRFHSRGVSPIHVGKCAFYRREFDPKDPQPFASPPRVVLFDLAFSNRLPEDGKDRVVAALKDQIEFTQVVQDLFGMVLRSKLGEVQRVVEDVTMCRFNSFAQIAHLLDRSYGGKFSAEYRNIVGIEPAKPEESVRFNPQDFSYAARFWERTREAIPNLGREGGIIEGLLPKKVVGKKEFQVHLAEMFMDRMVIDKGLRTRDQIVTHIMSPNFPDIDREGFLVRLSNGRTILDSLLEELENRGIVVGSSQKPGQILTLGEQILRLIKASTATEPLPVSRAILDEILYDDDIKNSRFRDGEEGFSTEWDYDRGFATRDVVYDYLAEQGVVRD